MNLKTRYMKTMLPVFKSKRKSNLLIYLSIFFLLPIISEGQQLEGVWGLKWGMPVDSVIVAIKKSKGYTPKIQSTDTTIKLSYQDAKWGFEKSLMTTLYFYKNKLYSAVGIFLPNTPKEIFDTYYNLKQSIIDKYFEPQTDEEEFVPPYSKSDSYNEKITAILKGYGAYRCYWNFSLASHLKYDGEITLGFTNSFGIMLIYQDGNISNLLGSINDELRKKDF